ncbi:outer membrane receptor for ferric coprogen and ferric-rhodotorulic acid [Pseudomonas nitritireducens]|uniref:Outer membrane receptor for ferric coprogen and ferric-rhodotorulic acid n=1 Tax=Pseudomonas nitroreducens TaxID=46680 RepID=A0A7W7KR37_PSENT|nr:TonB-dependent receptor [Pseudomonas nitritireducens]MBB4866703.1 outer membrane receptor for ferric coprogen and ferric-rhodotorulic acid [Pseudomonas nitritireducens]
MTLHPIARALRQSLGFALISCSALAVLPAMPVQAESAATRTQHYAIAAGPLDQVLGEFGRRAGIPISVDAGLTEGKRSGGLNGDYSIDDGFARILSGTRLSVRRLDNGGYGLVPTPAEAVLEMDSTTVSSQLLDPTSEGTNSYSARAVTIGKGAHSLRETPQSVTVLTRRYMDDQNINTIDQAMEKTPGIAVYESPMGGKYFYSRGFMMQGQYQYDGVPLDVGGEYVQANSFSGDMAFYDRVEVLKGAAGMLKGSGSSTGGVNFVRKRGQAVPETRLSLSAGSWDNYRGQVDVGGPLNESGTLRGRTVVALQDRQYFYDVGKRNDQILYGALDYDVTPDTTVGLGVAYEKLDATPCWHGLPRYSNGKDLKLSRSTCLGASWNNWESERTTLFADLSHQLNEDWAFKFAGVWTHNDQNMKYALSETNGGVTPGATSAPSSVYSGLFDYDQTDYGFDAYLDGKFDAFGLQHELTVGANASRAKTHDSMALINMSSLLGASQDPFHPNSHIPEPADDFYAPNSYRGGPVPTETDTRQFGTYATLRLKLAEPLTAVLGSRVSWYRNSRDSYTQAWDYWQHDRSQENGQVTPFAALIYDLNDQWSIYTSYADIFQPQSTYTDESGSPLQPKTGASYELGIKGELLDGRVNTAFNLFRTVEEHRAEANYDTVCAGSSDGYCYTDVGKVRAQGFEAEVSGEVIERLQLLAGYTYTQTKYLNSAAENPQEPTFTTTYFPRHLFRAWADYQLAGELDRWNVGAGVTAQSDTSVRSGSVTSVQSDYAIWNGRLGYRLDEHWNVALNGNNLFDKKYYQSVGAVSWGNFYGEPRNFMVTLQGSF